MNDALLVALGLAVGLGMGFVMGLERQGGAARGAVATEVLLRSMFTGISRVTGLLLELGADARTQDTGGFTALHHASCFYDGHDPKHPGQQHQDVFAKLVGAGAPLDGLDGEGRTPLHRAVETGNAYGVGRLLSLGANTALPVRTENGPVGVTAWARSLGREEIALLLDQQVKA